MSSLQDIKRRRDGLPLEGQGITLVPKYSKTCLKRTCSKADERFCTNLSVYWWKSHKPNLPKADTYLKRTKILVQKVSALGSFHCIKTWLDLVLFEISAVTDSVIVRNTPLFNELCDFSFNCTFSLPCHTPWVARCRSKTLKRVLFAKNTIDSGTYQ